jgi:hypothetical protein
MDSTLAGNGFRQGMGSVPVIDSSPARPTSAPPGSRRIDAVCTCFEAAWRTDAPPRIVDFLDDWSGAELSALLLA